jgi:hypothetical protein
MKFSVLLLLTIFATSCQFSETIYIDNDGSGTIQTTSLRDEQSYLKLVLGNYNNEDIFKDTTYVVKDFISKYSETFDRISDADKAIFMKYKDVQVHVKNSSYEKEFRTTILQKFASINEVVDLYKTTEYVSDIRNNYALSAEEHYYKVNYLFDGKVFNRKVIITDEAELKKQIAMIDTLKTKYGKLDILQQYRLEYHFPKRIKSISNPNASIEADHKSLILNFLISDCLQNPESTNLEVILE